MSEFTAFRSTPSFANGKAFKTSKEYVSKHSILSSQLHQILINNLTENYKIISVKDDVN